MAVTRARRTALVASLASVLLLGLSSCALLEGPTPQTPDRPAPELPATPAVFVPGGTAEENLPFFTQTLLEYAAGDAPIEGQPIVDAVAAGGFDKADMQVSFDHSKTNLVADSIYVAVRAGEQCLIGQIATAERDVAAEAVAATGPGRDVCLIGSTRQIDW